jgi:hypothetical protein
MKLSKLSTALLLTTSLSMTGCSSADKTQTAGHDNAARLKPGFEHRLDIYKTITLKTDLSHLMPTSKK